LFLTKSTPAKAEMKKMRKAAVKPLSTIFNMTRKSRPEEEPKFLKRAILSFLSEKNELKSHYKKNG
jgi:hypothetical protein